MVGFKELSQMAILLVMFVNKKREWLWSGPGINCKQATKHTSEGSILALKPRGDVARSPKQGYQWPHEKDLCPQKIKNKNDWVRIFKNRHESRFQKNDLIYLVTYKTPGPLIPMVPTYYIYTPFTLYTPYTSRPYVHTLSPIGYLDASSRILLTQFSPWYQMKMSSSKT